MRHARSGVREAVRPAAEVADPILAVLNDALGHEVAGYLRHKGQYFAAKDLGAGSMADELLEHARRELGQAQRLAARIVTLGGAPDFAPQELADADRIAMRLTPRPARADPRQPS